MPLLPERDDVQEGRVRKDGNVLAETQSSQRTAEATLTFAYGTSRSDVRLRPITRKCPLTLTLSRGEGTISFPLPSGERTKVRGGFRWFGKLTQKVKM